MPNISIAGRTVYTSARISKGDGDGWLQGSACHGQREHHENCTLNGQSLLSNRSSVVCRRTTKILPKMAPDGRCQISLVELPHPDQQ